MIPVAKPQEPQDFDAQIGQPGLKWLEEKDATGCLWGKQKPQRPPALWTDYPTGADAVAQAFAHRCGYAAMLDPTGGTVDHYYSWDNFPYLAYEWENYRHVCGFLNSSKRSQDDALLDPFEVGPGWFALHLPSLQLHCTERIPDALRARAVHTLQHLHLDCGIRILNWRRLYLSKWLNHKWPLDELDDSAPLLAQALRRDYQRWQQGELPAGDSSPQLLQAYQQAQLQGGLW